MSKRTETRHPVAQSIFVFAVVILVFSLGLGIGSGWLASSHLLSFAATPLVISLICVMVPTAAGAGWFRLKTNRAMSGSERLRFAAGVVLANLLLLIGGFAAGLAFLGETQVLAKHSVPLRDVFANYILAIFVTWSGLLVQLLIFAQAYVLALVLTQRRQRNGAAHAEPR